MKAPPEYIAKLKLLAYILENDYPPQVSPPDGTLPWSEEMKRDIKVLTQCALLLDWELRIKPVPDHPEFGPWHNPHGLCEQQVGSGYRLLMPWEVDGRFSGEVEVWNEKSLKWHPEWHMYVGDDSLCTYRVSVNREIQKPS